MNEKSNFENIREVAPATSEGELENVTSIESYQEKKERGCEEAEHAIQKLIEAVPETEELLFRERPCKSPAEKVMAQYGILLEGLEDLAERLKQKEDYYTRKAVLAYKTKVEAEKIEAGVSFDYMEHKQFARMLLEKLPFLEQVPNLSTTQEADDYNKVDGVYANAA